jgi:phytoene synthase
MSLDAGTWDQGWENRLLAWAYEGIHAHAVSATACAEVAEAQLERAYTACADLTREHSRTFYLASGLLPTEKRQAVRALYAFCRISDDIVDTADPSDPYGTLAALRAWRKRILGQCDAGEEGPVLAWINTQAHYGIPGVYAEQLINGVERDLIQTRYTTFEELTAYCYGVASTVGLMSMYIVGFDGPQALPYAVKLGVALQLTNILRDVAEDWAGGRLYLPLDELARFGLTEADIEAGRVDDRWRAFMRFQINRVRRLYRASLPGVRMLHRDGRFAIGAAAELYQAILTDIEAHDMDVFHRRAHTGAWGKLRRLPGIWWRSYLGGYAR